MITTGKHIPRRHFIRGLGVAIALPLLDSMIPASVGQTAKAIARKGSPLRLSFAYVPNGVVMEDWTPLTEGAGFDHPAILEPLAPSPAGDPLRVLPARPHLRHPLRGDPQEREL